MLTLLRQAKIINIPLNQVHYQTIDKIKYMIYYLPLRQGNFLKKKLLVKGRRTRMFGVGKGDGDGDGEAGVWVCRVRNLIKRIEG